MEFQVVDLHAIAPGRLAQRQREEKTDLLLEKRAGLDHGAETLLQQGDALLDDVFRGWRRP